MKGEKALQKRLQRALRDRVPYKTDSKGYVRFPTENLIADVCMDQFEADLIEGAGDELRMKFCAAHSSTALAVNCFAWFKCPDRRGELWLHGEKGAGDIRFERKLPIFGRGTPPHLDVWIERKFEVIAIESKLTEHLVSKKARFRPAYDQLAPPGLAEKCWWNVMEEAKQSGPRNLDIAQLVKHYFGLRRCQQKQEITKRLALLYLFWEPQDWAELDVCHRHRQECDELARATADSVIPFRWMSYADLWTEWSNQPETRAHVANLRSRYSFINIDECGGSTE